jgi:predicted transcriptional regulator
MTRTTVTLPEDLAALLAREARRHHTSVSEIVRQAVAAFLDVPGGARRELPFAALGRSGRRHTARDAEKILVAEWGRGRRR